MYTAKCNWNLSPPPPPPPKKKKTTIINLQGLLSPNNQLTSLLPLWCLAGWAWWDEESPFPPQQASHPWFAPRHHGASWEPVKHNVWIMTCTEASQCFMGACQTQWLNHDLHWGITVLHGSLSNTMTESWLALRHHGASWEHVKHIESWLALRHHGASWEHVKHIESWLALRHHGASWEPVKHIESWLALRHHGASWEPVKHNVWITLNFTQ